jgi:carboxyl-terminal processing protease
MIISKLKFFSATIAFQFILNVSNSQVDQDQIFKFNQVIENINNFYVDSVNESYLIEKAIIATLKELDPHSLYYPKEEVEEINRGLNGSFTGIGITYDIIDDTLLIISVLKESPAAKAGLKPGDRILQIQDHPIAGNGLNDKIIKELFKGEKGKELIVTIQRRNHAIINTTVVLDEIPVNSITSSFLFNNEIAYIKLNRFGSKSVNEFKSVTDTMIKEGITKMIIDLRDNSGGYLYVSINLLENFLEKNTIVLYTKGDKSPDKEYKTQIPGKFKNIDLVVLIDETTASAGEIFSGAIQDWDRGIIVGRRSFGKGLVQKPVYLVDGSMIRLTIARYYTPSGRNIQKPYNSDFETYENDLEDRFKKGELLHKDSIKHSDSIKYHTLSNHRVIYGGGGIVPDVFIPIDTLGYPGYYTKKINTGKISEFVHIYVDKNRDYFENNFPNFNDFNKAYEFTKENAEELIEYVYKDDSHLEHYKIELTKSASFYMHIKALIADDLYDENAFFKIYNNQDEAFQKAVEILRNKKLYEEILNGEVVGEYKGN